MTQLIEFAILAFSAFFVIIDPVGVVPLFLALTPGASLRRRREMALRACIVAWVLLTVFSLFGSFIFQALGITLSAFKVAGGLLLLLTAIDQLRAQPTRTRTTDEEQRESATKDDISIVPLAIPLLAGPGSIATAMMLTSRAETPLQAGVVLIAITVTITLAYIALSLGDRLTRLLGKNGEMIAERVVGLVLAAIAVQFVLDGIKEALAG